MTAPQDGATGAAQEAQALAALLLRQCPDGVFALDGADRIAEPVSPSLARLFRRDTFSGLTLPELLQPLVPRKVLGLLREHLAAVRAILAEPAPAAMAPLELELRFANGQGGNDLLHYVLEFTPFDGAATPGMLLVRVTDRTTALLQEREIEDLRQQLATQGDVLQTVLRAGTRRFAGVLRTTDTLLGSINEILRRPAREQAAFRAKLDQTLSAVDRIGRNLATTSLHGLSSAAQRFETALLHLRERPVLSGNDFLPLAVRLDELLVQFSQVQALTRSLDLRAADEAPADAGSASQPNATGLNRTVSPKFVMDLLERPGSGSAADPGAGATPPASEPGTLAHTLARLTENVATEQRRQVRLECVGLDALPPEYLSTVKNVAVQLVRNAVMHGIEPPNEREALRKPPVGRLRLEFARLDDGSYELTFEDDGRGIDPASVREVAVARSMITPGAAGELGDRQALKMIFKSRYTTLSGADAGKKHGPGLAFVRRYVHDAGGLISLGSDPGRSTRFKVTLPALSRITATG